MDRMAFKLSNRVSGGINLDKANSMQHLKQDSFGNYSRLLVSFMLAMSHTGEMFAECPQG